MNSRRNRGFERAGVFGVRHLGLPAVRTRELDLAVSWRLVVGEMLARRVQAVRVRRGVLEVQLVAPGADSTGAIADRLPRLGRGLAQIRPDLGVRAVRLLAHEEGRRVASRPLAPESPGAAPDQKL